MKLENILNRYLALDPESKKRLKALDGKIISVVLPVFSFQLKILNERVYLQTEVETPDVTIKGSPLSLIHLSFADDKTRKKFFAEDVVIEGDLELGQQIIDLFDELEIDWEEYLSQVVGDVPAHHTGNVVRRVKNFSKKARAILYQNINEYAHEEINLFPPREALEDFFQEVDEVRMESDRLEQSVKRLEAVSIAARRIFSDLVQR